MTTKKLIVIIISIILAIAAGTATAFFVVKYTENTVSPNENSSHSEFSSLTESVIETIAPIPEPVTAPLVFSSPAKSNITVTEPVVTFSGTSDPTLPLSLAGIAVERDEKGAFSFTQNLSIGKNTFSFSYDGQTVTYTVNYRYVVISNYAPSTNQMYSSGSTFSVEVTARKGSSVKATFNGQTISLSPDTNSTDEFIKYIGSYKLPSDNYADLNLGKITYTATCNGITESFSSGKVTCKRPDFIVDYDPNATPLGGRYVNVGSGKIAEIIAYEAETFDPGSTDDKSRPTNSYLPKGTVDYSAQEYIYYGDSKKYAVLRCGKQVYTHKNDTPGNKNVAIIKEYAGTLPDHNEIGIASFENGSQHSTLTLDTMWKAPFYLDILPQQYNNPNKQDYTISQPTYNYIDITFCYATVLTGEILIPEDNPLFKSAQIIKNQSDYTLRLELKKQGGFYGWDANYNDQGQLVFEFLNPAKVTVAENTYGVDLTGVEIFIDVGHGGADPGALGLGNSSHTEAIQNLILANKIKAELESIGATVYINRTANTTSTNLDKIKMLKDIKPDYCIAIHHNSSTSSRASGFDSCYFNAFSKKAAEYVWMHTSNTGIYKSNSLGWHYYYMARSYYCPVVLTENGYISNSYDYNNIISDSVNNSKAKAITKGIAEYFKSIQ